MAVRRELESTGYRMVTAFDGDAAIEAFESEPPDVVLIDVVLPSIDGFEVCRRIREFSEVPVVMVSSKGGEADKVKG